MSTLRTITLNLWGERGPLADRMALCRRQLEALEPDLIALQEVRHIEATVPNQAVELANALAMKAVFAPRMTWGGGIEGLAILSRFPIQASDHIELPHATIDERRIALWALVNGEKGDLAVVCTHLNYRLDHGIEREDQVLAIDDLVKILVRKYDPALTIIMGDFNTDAESDEIRFLRGQHSLRGRRTYYQDAFLIARKLHRRNDTGLTWSRDNPYMRQLHWLDPDRRLDYVFVSPMREDGRGTVRDCVVTLATPENEVYPSDHYGVLADIQI